MATDEAGTAIHALGTDSKDIEDYYEEWGAEKYEANLRSWGYTATTRVTELIAKHSNVPPAEAQVLDAGVGTGVQATDLSSAGFQSVTGIDIWQGGLEHAQKRGFYRALQQADLQKPLPAAACPEASFDIVICVGVLTYIKPESCCLSELLRATKRGGIICYTNRTDKLEAWHAVEQALVASGAWELVARTERVPYLPHNQEFGRDTEIVISTWRKL